MLPPGTRIAGYEILAPLGAGGMGEVYRARDTTLGREIALKVLPDLFAGDPERLARFEREARTLAALNHPNIAHIHGVVDAPAGSAGDPERPGPRVRGLVMELVEGLTLADVIHDAGSDPSRIGTGGLPLADVLAIARQLADALDAAHERGVIHRDLKPANIKVTSDGAVKVLDFGLAKAMDAGGTSGVDVLHSPTVTSPLAMTGAGVILGTAAYMAPEQARGKAVDRRADVWAFGCVIFEMLAGRRAFDGESVTDVLAAVLKNDPDWTMLPADTPPAMRRLLRRCLERDPKRRLRDMGDARLELDDPDEVVAVRREARSRPPVLLLVACFVAGALAASLVAWSWLTPGSAAPSPVRRFGLSLPVILDAQQSVALSPDGSQLAFRGLGDDGVDRLYVRALDSVAPRGIPGTEGARQPFFAADGQQIGFFAGGHLKRVSLAGGEPQNVARAPNPAGGSWADDNTILYVPDSRAGIQRVPASGGTPETLLEPGEGQVATPWALPGGRGVLYAVRHGTRFDVAVMRLPDRTVRVLGESGWTPVWSDTGHVLYQQDDTILALPFDLRRFEPVGSPLPALVGVGTRISLQSRMFSVAANGTLAYMPAASGSNQRWAMAWVDRNGQESAIAQFAEAVDSPRLSPDGARVAFRKPAPNCDVWTYEPARGTSSRLTLEGDNHGVIWSADGERVMTVRIGDAPELIAVLSDGSGRVERLSTSSPSLGWPTSWAGSLGTALVTQGSDVVAVSTRTGEVQLLLESPFAESHAMFSPDFRWIAYVSDQSGRSEVYVQPFPGQGRRIQVSTDGGSEPVWSRDGRELFFRSGRALLAAAFDPATGPGADRPRPLFSTDHLTGAGVANYDVSPDGTRFLMIRGPARRDEGNLVVVLNWLDTWVR